MDSSSIPANDSTPSQSNPPEQETTPQPKKRNPAFSKESLRSTLNEISKETEQISQVLPKQPENEDVYKAIEKLDQKQKIWLRLYIVWLIYNLRGFGTLFMELLSPLPEELEEYEDMIRPIMNLSILIQFGIVLLTSCPYLIQLWAIYKKNLKRTNTFIKIMKVLFILNGISLAYSCFVYFNFDKVKEMISSYEIPGAEEEKELLEMYPKEFLMEYMVSSLYETAESLVCILLCYVGAVKYRNYLMQRENLTQKTNKVE